MQDILVFGKNGQISTALSIIIPNANYIGLNDCDFSKKENIEDFLNNLKYLPKIIINASAYTKVDLAETEKDLCLEINANSVKIIAEFCNRNDIIFIHYSTDYVFDGTGDTEFDEENTINLKPLNYYGYTKLLGDKYIQKSNCKFYIIRVSWVYYEFGQNFVKTMLKLLQEKGELNIINDQIGSPAYALDVAKITLEFVKQKPKYGIYNFTNEGFISWFDFVLEIKNIIENDSRFNVKTKIINKITSDKYITVAKRGLNSRLSKEKIKNNLNINLENWKDSLKKMIKNYAEQPNN